MIAANSTPPICRRFYLSLFFRLYAALYLRLYVATYYSSADYACHQSATDNYFYATAASISSDSNPLSLYRRQFPKFTKANGKENQMGNKGSQRQMPSGWNKNGLETFNELAREVYKDRKKHGVEFDKAFKISCEKEKMSSTNTTRKRRKRN
jgi:hypothetical protein